MRSRFTYVFVSVLARKGLGFGQEPIPSGVSIFRCAGRVHHVCEPAKPVLLQAHSGTGRVFDVGEVSHRVIGIVSGAFGYAPAVSEPVIGIVKILERQTVVQAREEESFCIRVRLP